MVATEILGQAVESAKGDLLTIEGNVFRQIEDPNDKKRKILVPVKVEAHVSPISLLGGLAAGLLGTLAATIAWHGINIPAPLGGAIELMPGIKDTTLGKDLSDSYDRWKTRRRIRTSGGVHRRARTGLTGDEIQTVLKESVGDTECQLLNREWAKARRRGDLENVARFRKMAEDKACPWIDQI